MFRPSLLFRPDFIYSVVTILENALRNKRIVKCYLLPISGIISEILQHLWAGDNLFNMETQIPRMAWVRTGPVGVRGCWRWPDLTNTWLLWVQPVTSTTYLWEGRLWRPVHRAEWQLCWLISRRLHAPSASSHHLIYTASVDVTDISKIVSIINYPTRGVSGLWRFRNRFRVGRLDGIRQQLLSG